MSNFINFIKEQQQKSLQIENPTDDLQQEIHIQKQLAGFYTSPILPKIHANMVMNHIKNSSFVQNVSQQPFQKDFNVDGFELKLDFIGQGKVKNKTLYIAHTIMLFTDKNVFNEIHFYAEWARYNLRIDHEMCLFVVTTNQKEQMDKAIALWQNRGLDMFQIISLEALPSWLTNQYKTKPVPQTPSNKFVSIEQTKSKPSKENRKNLAKDELRTQHKVQDKVKQNKQSAKNLTTQGKTSVNIQNKAKPAKKTSNNRIVRETQTQPKKSSKDFSFLSFFDTKSNKTPTKPQRSSKKNKRDKSKSKSPKNSRKNDKLKLSELSKKTENNEIQKQLAKHLKQEKSMIDDDTYKFLKQIEKQQTSIEEKSINTKSDLIDAEEERKTDSIDTQEEEKRDVIDKKEAKKTDTMDTKEEEKTDKTGLEEEEKTDETGLEDEEKTDVIEKEHKQTNRAISQYIQDSLLLKKKNK